MRVEASETSLAVWPGTPAVVTVSVFNTADVICGYRFEMLGVDSEWLRLDYDQLNLFPEDTGTVTITLTLPADFPAGRRNLAVVVHSALDAADYRVIDIEFDVQATPEARLELEPSNIYGGTVGTFGLVITNTGNSWTRMVPVAEEDEEKAKIQLIPEEVDVPPGEQATVTADVRRRRPWFGSPATRVISFRVEGVEHPPQAVGSFTQRPLIGRGLLSLAGLLAALTVFGFVLTSSLGLLVDKTNANDELVKTALAQEQAALELAASNPRSISGSVVQQGDIPVGNVTVQLFGAEANGEPVSVVATAPDSGTYTFQPVAAGDYKIRVIGAGFEESWFPSAPTFEEAETLTLTADADLEGKKISILSRPGLVSGTVLAPDPSDVVVSLFQIGADGNPAAIVREVTTDGNGVFILEDVPPGEDQGRTPYLLVAVKPGFAEDRRLITVSEAEIKENITIRLRQGDARIGGTVQLAGQLPQPDELITVTASAGGDQFSTVTFNGGEYLFRDLPSPAAYAITASRPGFTGETQNRQLASAGSLTDVDFDLSSETRTVKGTVRSAQGSTALSGVLVTVSDGQTNQQTRTGADGGYEFRALSPVSTYTITASHPKRREATLSCGPAPQGCDSGRTDFLLQLATGRVFGVVCNQQQIGTNPPTVNPVGGVTVTLRSATFEATTVSANNESPNGANKASELDSSFCVRPASLNRAAGYYRFAEVPIGTYTITFRRENSLSFTQAVTVTTGDTQVLQTLVSTSSVKVTVTSANAPGTPPVPGATVRLCEQGEFPTSPPVNCGTVQTTDGTGVILFRDVRAPKDYVVVVTYKRTGEDPQVVSRSFSLVEGQTQIETVSVLT